MSFSFLSYALLGLAYISPASAALGVAQNIPPKPANVSILGKTKDPNFNTNIYRDGGSSVYANGYHMMIFADTIVDQHGPTPESALTAHNSLAYFGYDNPTDPTIMHDFGSQTPHTMDNVLSAPMATIPFSNETSEYGIWPSSNMAVLSDGVTTVGMFPLVHFASSTAVYNTMVTVKVIDPKSMGSSGPPTKRVVNQFFYADEPLYGGLSIVRGFLDGYLYMFASVSNGVKLARVQEDKMTDRSEFEYWDGQQFQSQMPGVNSSSANVVQFSVPTGFGADVGPDVGDVFWSNFHNTFLMIFMDATVSGQFWVSYSKDGSFTNWSTPEKLWQPLPNPTWADECDASGMGGKWNYAGHSHPDWDPSGKTLLLSWSSCTVFVNMATLTWQDSTINSLLPTANSSSSSSSSPSSTPAAKSTTITTTHAAAKLAKSSGVSSQASSTTIVPALPTGPVLSLGADGAVHFAAALEAYSVRKRVAAAPVQAPPTMPDRFARR